MIVSDRRSKKPVSSSILAFALLCATPSAVFADPASAAPAATAPAAPTPADAVVAPAYAPPADASDIGVRLICNGRTRFVWTHAQTVGEFLISHGIRVAEHDFVSASSDVALADGMTLEYRAAKKVAVAHVRRAHTPSSLAAIAARGFSSAFRFAGSALHMIATAYTSSCYGCSGITASGAHAGFGVIAVDPSIIPLGTKLFIPGYGRAVAGDTGGAIVGHRVDLGMNTLAQAMRFGRRSVTVYILR